MPLPLSQLSLEASCWTIAWKGVVSRMFPQVNGVSTSCTIFWQGQVLQRSLTWVSTDRPMSLRQALDWRDLLQWLRRDGDTWVILLK